MRKTQAIPLQRPKKEAGRRPLLKSGKKHLDARVIPQPIKTKGSA